jgi:DNA-binding transcriptional ArsR family regulator
MITKSELFASEDVELARIAKAIAHPARIRILRLLAECDRCITGTLVTNLPLAQATVSQHLRALRDAGLIAGEIEGAATCYCLDEEALRRASAALEALFGSVCCGGTPQYRGGAFPEGETDERVDQRHCSK